MSHHKKEQEILAEDLLRAEVFTPEILASVLEEYRKTKVPILELLIRGSRNYSEAKLLQYLTKKYPYQVINPDVFLIESDILKLLPQKMAEKHLALPVSRFEDTLTVAFANPMNLKAVDEIRAMTHLRIRPCLAAASSLRKAIAKNYLEQGPVEVVSKPMENSEDIDELFKIIQDQEADKGEGASQLLKIAYETPVIKLVNMLLSESIRRRASDIFIEPWENHVRVRARVDGLLEEIIKAQKSSAHAIVSRIKVMSELDIAEHRVPQDGRFKVKIHNREVDLRVSILPTSFGEKVCLRILDTTAQSHDISKLGFDEREQGIIKDCARSPHGMILVTGPTGSGKTTTLYSVLKYLDSPEVNITTVEDPVEYQLPGINQVNVREHVGLTFPAALRSMLRQDPDIILIGEIRDNTTLDIAVKAALTGHLVLSTLHTNDAASSITRMMNMGLEPFLIASTVLMISAQRLVRRLCSRCRYAEDVEPHLIELLKIDTKKPVFYKGRGCPECRQSGYKGRTVITEILQMTPEVRALIMQGASAEEIKEHARKHGMTTLRECAIKKALEGETSLEEVFRVTSEDQGSLEAAKAEKRGDKEAA